MITKLGALIFVLLAAPALAQEPEVLARGPVHEAYAMPLDLDPAEAFVIPKAPPAAIEEIPPETKPEGADVQWIAGYWSWDEERSDFIWVSGLWRDIPPGKHWTAGLFVETGTGWRWVPGFWADDEEPQIVASAPPATLEAGPNIPAPSEDQIWVSGSWLWRDAWVWQPGSWMGAHDEWLWSPAYYVWTPRGYRFVRGFWDYVPARRGYVFAPVYYGPRWIWVAGYRWRPSMAIDGDLLFAHFFCHRRYRHYYFGDYHGAEHTRRGIVPWFSGRSGARSHEDPIFAHAAWEHRRQAEWRTQVTRDYASGSPMPATGFKPVAEIARTAPHRAAAAAPPGKPAIEERRIEQRRVEERRVEERRPSIAPRVEQRRIPDRRAEDDASAEGVCAPAEERPAGRIRGREAPEEEQEQEGPPALIPHPGSRAALGRVVDG